MKYVSVISKTCLLAGLALGGVLSVKLKGEGMQNFDRDFEYAQRAVGNNKLTMPTNFAQLVLSQDFVCEENRERQQAVYDWVQESARQGFIPFMCLSAQYLPRYCYNAEEALELEVFERALRHYHIFMAFCTICEIISNESDWHVWASEPRIDLYRYFSAQLDHMISGELAQIVPGFVEMSLKALQLVTERLDELITLFCSQSTKESESYANLIGSLPSLLSSRFGEGTCTFGNFSRCMPRGENKDVLVGAIHIANMHCKHQIKAELARVGFMGRHLKGELEGELARREEALDRVNARGDRQIAEARWNQGNRELQDELWAYFYKGAHTAVLRQAHDLLPDLSLKAKRDEGPQVVDEGKQAEGEADGEMVHIELTLAQIKKKLDEEAQERANRVTPQAGSGGWGLW